MVIPKAMFRVSTLLLLFIANYFVSLEAFALYPNTSHVNVVRCIDKERQALLKFKESLEDPGGLLSSWFGSDCCTWKGVGCRYPTGEVVKLHLSNPKCYEFDYDFNDPPLCLGGKLSHYLDELENLSYLNLSYNYFSGMIPPQLGNLSNLRVLDLHWVGYDIYVSDLNWISGLSSLKFLDFSYLNLSLATTHWLQAINNIPSLVELHLLHTNLQSNPLYLSRSNLTSLSVLDLSYNNFSTQAPQWLINITTSVVVLKLSGCYFKGPISSLFGGSLFRYNHNYILEELGLSGNGFSGELPDSFGHLKSLTTLDLSYNAISGSLPTSIGRLSKLEILRLGYNKMNGSIPKSLGRLGELKILDLSGNSLNGSIPSSVGKMNNLDVLLLSDNQLSGKVHDNWMNKLISLIDLSNNNLSGEFPASLCSLPKLFELKLSNNLLFGKLPSSVKNCKKLSLLDLGENKFSGSIPKWIGENHSWLHELRMRGNLFNGNIPKQFCSLQNLHVLDLARNNLSGPIPTCFSQLKEMRSTDLIMGRKEMRSPEIMGVSFSMDLVLKGIGYTYDYDILKLVTLIDFSCNNLTGLLPEDITNLAGLGTLNLSNNHLTGKIPSRIGEMQNLETLDLSSNHFYGQIPPSMSSMTFLSHLNLSYNDLSGRIPSGNQFSTFDESVYEGNSGLCGSPLPKCGPLVQKEGGDDHDEDGDEEDDGKLGLFVSVALGFIFGFWSICGSLVIKKSWRDAYYGFLDKTKDWIMVVVALNLNRLRIMIARMGN